MGNTSAQIEIEVPLGPTFDFVKDAVTNPQYLKIYETLSNGKPYSGRIIEESSGHHLLIQEASVDGLTNIRLPGWTIRYDFEEVSSSKTKVTITIEYGALLAILGMSTVHGQSINEVLARITNLLALERGRTLD